MKCYEYHSLETRNGKAIFSREALAEIEWLVVNEKESYEIYMDGVLAFKNEKI